MNSDNTKEAKAGEWPHRDYHPCPGAACLNGCVRASSKAPAATADAHERIGYLEAKLEECLPALTDDMVERAHRAYFQDVTNTRTAMRRALQAVLGASPDAETVLIDGKTYQVHPAVAAEMLRLHLEGKA